MKIRILTMLVGSGVAYMPGEVVDVDDAEARRWIAAGYAQTIHRADESEAAVKRPRETTTRRRAKPRGD